MLIQILSSRQNKEVAIVTHIKAAPSEIGENHIYAAILMNILKTNMLNPLYYTSSIAVLAYYEQLALSNNEENIFIKLEQMFIELQKIIIKGIAALGASRFQIYEKLESYEFKTHESLIERSFDDNMQIRHVNIDNLQSKCNILFRLWYTISLMKEVKILSKNHIIPLSLYPIEGETYLVNSSPANNCKYMDKPMYACINDNRLLICKIISEMQYTVDVVKIVLVLYMEAEFEPDRLIVLNDVLHNEKMCIVMDDNASYEAIHKEYNILRKIYYYC